MPKIRLTRSVTGFADFSVDLSRSGAVRSFERSRKIPEKWLFAFGTDFDIAVRRSLHAAAARTSGGFERKLRQLGETFAKLLFYEQTELDSVFGAPPEMPVVFVVDGEYAHLPYEALHDGSQFLADRSPVVRVLRTNAPPPVGKEKFFRRPLLYLPTIAPEHPEVHASAIAERDRLIAQLRKNKNRMRIATDSGNAGAAMFLSHLQEADAVHFSGHASATEIPLPDGARLLPDDMAELNLSHVRVVFLNACDSARQKRDAAPSFASVFVRAGVANFIGYARPVPNKVAETVAAVFWSNFLRGAPAHLAIAKVREELRKSADIGAYRFFIQHFGNFEVERKSSRSWMKYAAAALSLIAIASFSLWQMRQKIREKSPAKMPVAAKPAKAGEHKNKVQPHKKKKLALQSKSDAELAGLIEQFVPISMKHDFSPEEIRVMDRLWRHLDTKGDKNNIICKANLDNGNKRSGSMPIGRRQIIRNLLVFRCIPEAPADWDAHIADKLRLHRKN
ncbi:MAG: hypothetical protein OHK0011_00040 [Turneriella sp.]